MKKILLIAAIAVFGFSNVNAQDINFGAKAGVDLATSKVESSGFSASGSETGFYVGFFAEIGISEEFIFQPEVIYVAVKDFDQINIPLLAKYAVSEEFKILAGPAIGILLDTAEGFSSLNYGIEAGVAYDFSEEFFAEARYNIGLANLIEDAPSGVSAKISGFFIGVGYKF